MPQVVLDHAVLDKAAKIPYHSERRMKNKMPTHARETIKQGRSIKNAGEECCYF